MDIEAVPGRISLGVITLLAVSQQGGQGRNYDYTKLERFLPKNQRTQRKLLNFGEVSEIGHHFRK